MRHVSSLLGTFALTLLAASCSDEVDPGAQIGVGGFRNNDNLPPDAGVGGSSGQSGAPNAGGMGGALFPDEPECTPMTCAEAGWACGSMIDPCGDLVDCAEEGLACGDNQVCVGGVDGPTQCQGDSSCETCSAVPDCSAAAEPTRLSGRVVTPGRDAANTANQVGVPNATVYILRTTDVADLPVIGEGIPSGGLSCDRCEDQELGPVLAGAITDATGRFTIEGNVPVGSDFLLVTKAGKFRRAVLHPALPAEAACATTELPTSVAAEPAQDNPTRLPRTVEDGLAVHIPKIAVTTGSIDAMECVFEKMGLASSQFGNPDSSARVHLYRGTGLDVPAEGARLDDNTPHDSELYSNLDRLRSYDMIVSDCEGRGWDGRNAGAAFDPTEFPERIEHGDKLREYVNRGGRLFASHLSFTWLNGNGSAEYSEDAPLATGLDPAASWPSALVSGDLGIGVVSLHPQDARPRVSPRIDSFASWLEEENVTSAADDYEFDIIEPRSLVTGLGDHTEEFVYRKDGNGRVQQFSFATPYGAPDAATCGRVSYSGFHVAAGGGDAPYATSVFPDHCDGNGGNLTDQEKVLLYMLFDLGACVGDEPPPPPTCEPLSCDSDEVNRCGNVPDGCGNVLDCGPCNPGSPA